MRVHTPHPQEFTMYYDKISKMQTQMAREGRIRSATNKNTSIPPGGMGAAGNGGAAGFVTIES